MHRPRARGWRTLDALGWTLAAGVLWVVLGTACGDAVDCTTNPCPASEPYCNSASKCVKCSTDAHCKPGETCEVGTGTCIRIACGDFVDLQCNGECPAGEACTDQGGGCTCGTVPECAADTDCPGDDACISGDCATPCAGNGECATSSHGPLCQGGTCIECRNDADCPPETPLCSDGRCGTCLTDADCAGNPLLPRCAHNLPFCVQCLITADCTGGLTCDGTYCTGPFADVGTLDLSLVFANPKTSQSGEVQMSLNVVGDWLQLYRLEIQPSVPSLGVNFAALGPANTEIGSVEVDQNGDGTPDLSFAVRNVNDTISYVDADGDSAADAAEATLVHDPGTKTLTATLPSDGNLDDVFQGFSGRFTLTLSAGIVTNPSIAGTVGFAATATSVSAAPGVPPESVVVQTSARFILASCGDSNLDAGEDCDAGGESEPCDADCSFAVCGDGTTNQTAGEECDDGGTAAGDGCDGGCGEEAGWTCATAAGQSSTCTEDCVANPVAEIPCNGVDDDCDGADTCRTIAADSLTGTAAFDQKKPDNDSLKLKLGFAWTDDVFDPAVEGLGVSIEYDTGLTPILLGGGAGWKKTTIQKSGSIKWGFKDAKNGSLGDPGSVESATLNCNGKKDECVATISIKKLDLPQATATGPATVTLTIRDYQVTDRRTWELKSKGKKLVATRKADSDADGITNDVDLDDDGDGQTDADEVACGSDPRGASSTAPDFDGDAQADCVDPDDDNDLVPDLTDLCLNAGQPVDQVGCPASYYDPDGDGICNVTPGSFCTLVDNCKGVSNPGQSNLDGDADGDACDPDDDNDTLLDLVDNCTGVPNPTQANLDGDALGDACDIDDDGDGQSDVHETQCGSDPRNAGSTSPDDDQDGTPDCAECAVTVSGDWGTACCANPATCLVTEEGGPCTECLMRDKFGGTLDCTGDGATCLALSNHSVTCADCKYVAANLTADCDHANCTIRPNGTFGCQAQADSCEFRFADGSISPCPSDEFTGSCDRLVEQAVVDNAGAQRAFVRIKKRTEGGNDSFAFSVDKGLPSIAPFEFSIGTANGAGRSIAELAVDPATSASIRLGETILPPGWSLESIECTVAATPHPSIPRAVVVGPLSPGQIVECVFNNSKEPVAAFRAFSSLLAPEAVNPSNTFGLPAGNRIAVAGSNGFVVIDALTDTIPTVPQDTGSIPLSFVGFANPSNLYGALVVEHPADNDADALFWHGASTAASRQYFPSPPPPGFGFTALASFNNVTDATYFGGDPAGEGVLWVNRTSGSVAAHVWRTFPPGTDLLFSGSGGSLVSGTNVGMAFPTPAFVSAFAFDLVFQQNGQIVPPFADTDGDGIANAADVCSSTPSDQAVNATGCSQAQWAGRDDDFDGVLNSTDQCPATDPFQPYDTVTGCNATQTPSTPQFVPVTPGPPPPSSGWIATVIDGTPGKLWITKPGTVELGTLVGDVGNSPRRIRCLPSRGLCAVSNFASDSLTIVKWNGLGTASITGTATVGDGPVGIDLVTDGANTKVVSTGFNDDTYTITTLDPAGAVVGQPATQAVPAGCVDPGHAIWLPNVADTIVVTCKGSNGYAVISP